jgi:hypothetical protein
LFISRQDAKAQNSVILYIIKEKQSTDPKNIPAQNKYLIIYLLAT